ncbi:hypothetical protein D3C81_2316980 [compost metagenome]
MLYDYSSQFFLCLVECLNTVFINKSVNVVGYPVCCFHITSVDCCLMVLQIMLDL